jgi:hypothetical protein
VESQLSFSLQLKRIMPGGYIIQKIEKNGKQHTTHTLPAFTGFFVVVLRAFAILYIAGNCLGAVSIVDKEGVGEKKKKA